MVRWHPMPPDLPEAVRDFKHQLRTAIDRAGYPNLGVLAQSSGVPASTISDAASRAAIMPSKPVLARILRACKNPKIGDCRYKNWEELYQSACSALNSGPATSTHTEKPKEQISTKETSSEYERPPLAVYRSTVTRKGRSETTEIFFYSEAAVQHLIDRHVERKPAEAGDDHE